MSRDVYFYFAYPFLVAVPATPCARHRPCRRRARAQPGDAPFHQRARRRRAGSHFQLGLWTHAYQWVDSPNANYTIEGLTPENHASLLPGRAADAARGLPRDLRRYLPHPRRKRRARRRVTTSGRRFSTGMVRCGRKVEIDMHAKGMDQRMIDVALGTGMPVNDLAEVLGRAHGPVLSPGRRFASWRWPRAGPRRPGAHSR